MANCPDCGTELRHAHRTRWQRFVYTRLYFCGNCDTRLALPRRWVGPFMMPSPTFALSRHTRCIRCGTSRVQRLAKRDRVDTMSKHPFSLLMALTGAPINRCPACRLQYHDWRPIQREQK